MELDIPTSTRLAFTGQWYACTKSAYYHFKILLTYDNLCENTIEEHPCKFVNIN